ncbi:hypothetical protein [Terricaulis silvestris]|uniref:Uncharacterized protein n=1 Tax=Terricaulis silvestris TaxID=2686094 RepID=A0A6I6N097_9CAUL|nr:hypothetical protein [Terricaulis silvestris]QGZ96753.1 hypothetical protein DSM104635_03614 [Terricaulis silvestris]
MKFIRGANLLALNLSGPHASTVYHEVEDLLIERLDAFNSWVEVFNAMNPEPMLQQRKCTWMGFTRFQRQFMLRWNADFEAWELDGVIAKKPDDGDDGAAAAPDVPPEGPMGGGGVDLTLSGGFYLPPPRREQRRAPPLRGRRRRPPADQASKRPADAGREVAAPAKRKAARILCRTRVLLRRVRRSPRLRHIESQFGASVVEMKALCLLSRDTVHAFARAGGRWLGRKLSDVRSFFIEDFESEVRTLTHVEPRRIEIRQGFTLVLYNFERPDWESWLFGKLEIEIEYPNWESWLFGRPGEDEQKVA